MLTLRGPSGVRRGAALQDLGIIEDGSVLIREGTIAAVGSTRRLENLKEARSALEVPVNGRLIMPGFVDPSLILGLDGEQEARKRKRMGEFYDESLALMRSCLRHGTLAADVKASAGGESFHGDIAVLRKIAGIGNNPVRMMRTWRIGPQSTGTGGTGDFRKTLDVLIRRKLIHFIEFSGESGLTSDEQDLAAAQAAGIGFKLEWSGGSADVLANVLERLTPQAVCCLKMPTAAELALLANAPTVAVFSTGREILEGPANLSARQFIDAGGAIALSSGYESTSAASFSMQMSVSLAVIRLGLTPEEAFTASTINAAHAAGCAHLTGSLEFGKQADLLVLNVPDYREVPRQFGINHVDMVVRQGSIVWSRTRWRAATN